MNVPPQARPTLEIVTNVVDSMPWVLQAFGDFVRENRGGKITVHARKLGTFYKSHPERYPSIRIDQVAGGGGEEEDNGIFGIVLGKLADPVNSVIIPQLEDDGKTPRKLSQAGIVYDYDPAPDIKDVDTIRLAKIKPPKFTVRLVEDVTRMMASIKNTGQDHPITVRTLQKCCGDPHHLHFEYEIIDGYTRFKSCQYLGSITKIRAQVKDMRDREAFDFMIRSNIMRYEMNDVEQGFAFKLGIDNGWVKPQEIASELGHGIDYVYRRLKLLECVPETLERVKRGDITLDKALTMNALVTKQVMSRSSEFRISEMVGNGEMPRSMVSPVIKEIQESSVQGTLISPDQALVNVRHKTAAQQYEKKVSWIVIATGASRALSCPHCGFKEMEVDWGKQEIRARQTSLEEFHPRF